MKLTNLSAVALGIALSAAALFATTPKLHDSQQHASDTRALSGPPFCPPTVPDCPYGK